MRSRLLLDTVPEAPPLQSINGAEPYSGGGGNSDGGGDDAYFNTSLIVILAALLCTLIFVLGLNSMVRCAIRCSRRRRRLAALGTPEVAAVAGLKKQSFRQIPTVVYGPEATMTATDCPICLGEFAEGEKVRVLPACRHGFHARCIDAWLALQSSCPTCRRPVLLDKGGSEVGSQSSRADDEVAIEVAEVR